MANDLISFDDAMKSDAAPVSMEPKLSSQTISFEDAFQNPAKHPQSETSMKGEAAVRSAVEGLKNLGGTSAVFADMVLSLPGFAMGVGAKLGGTVQAMARGEKPAVAYSAGQAAGEHFAEPFMNPLQKLFGMLSAEKTYSESSGGKSLEAFSNAITDAGNWLEVKTGGRIPKEAMLPFVDTIMVGLTGIGSGKAKPFVDPVTVRRMRDQLPILQRDATQAAVRREEMRMQQEAARVPVQKQINDLLGIRSPEEQAKWVNDRRKQAKQGFNRPAEGSDYGSAAESIFRADERMQNEAAWRGEQQQVMMPEAPEISTEARGERAAVRAREMADALGEGQLDLEGLMAILQKPEEARTREELTALRRSNIRIGQKEVLDVLQKSPEERTPGDLETIRHARQEGKATPEALMLLSAAGIGSMAGMALDDEKLRGAMLGGATGLAPAAMLSGLRAGGVRSRFSQAGAVKGPGGMWHPEAVDRLSRAIEPPQYDAMQDADWLAHNPNLRRTSEQQTEWEQRRDARLPRIAWAQKAIRNYLNKYAGTEKDPLKDVEIPFGEGTKRWEELWDNTVKSVPAEAIQKKQLDPDTVIGVTRPAGRDVWSPFSGIEKAKPEERVFNFADFTGGDGYQGSEGAITSYLSHVGDYLRQNVALDALTWLSRQSVEAQRKITRDWGPHLKQTLDEYIKALPEYKRDTDLSRYDLTRAVRETAAHDAKMAKEMEKAASASMKDMPVYKEYPDGFKWVELKLPEKLTEAQAKNIRSATREERSRFSTEDGLEGLQFDGRAPQGAEYVAIGPDGKPIKNSYTGDVARGKTPEEAFLVGQLAQEGNVMGTCVGGYCPSVASGESKIYSLRDPKGKSHVTVEVAPKSIDSYRGTGYAADFWDQAPQAFKERYPEVGGDAAWRRKIESSPEFKAWFKEQPADITQIKGKQNRAPNAEYLPYVQDFVKGGRWGEVRDLGNTGLVRLGDQLSRLANAEDWGVNNLNAEQHRFRDRLQDLVTKEEFEALLQEPLPAPRSEEGFTRPEFLIGLTGLGLGSVAGATLAKDDKIGAAILGGLAGASLGLAPVHRAVGRGVEGLDYATGILSTRIGNISRPTMLALRRYEMRNIQVAREHLDKVVPFLKQLTKANDPALERAILTNDSAAIGRLMSAYPALRQAWPIVREVLDDLGTQLQGHGRFRTMQNDYFPRLVKDVDGLKEKLEAPVRQRLEQVLHDAEVQSMKNRGRPLTNIEESSIINREVLGHYRSAARQPGFTRARTVEQVTAELQPFYHTPQESLYTYIRGATQDIEMARFFGRDLVQTQRGSQQFTNVDQSIGNYVGRELREGRIDQKQADELISMLQSRFKGGERSPNKLIQDIRNLGNMGLLGSVVSAATQLGDTAMATYAQGFRANLTALAKKLSGRSEVTAHDFGLADHLAEEFVNPRRTANWLNTMLKGSGFSAVDRFGKSINLQAAMDRLSRRAQNDPAWIEAKYPSREMPELMEGLRNRRLNEDVRLALFSELSDLQPISKSEVPQAYLDRPNGRIMYMLKTFMLKQFDIVRRDAYNETKKGTPAGVATGLKNLTAYGMVLGLSGAGAEVVKDWLMGRPIKLDASDVLENTLKTFGWSEYVRNSAQKEGVIKAFGGSMLPPYKIMDDIIKRDPKAVQYIPLVGKLYYNWEMGGREDAELREAGKAKKEGRDFDLSDRARERRIQKRQEARERREREKERNAK